MKRLSEKRTAWLCSRERRRRRKAVRQAHRRAHRVRLGLTLSDEGWHTAIIQVPEQLIAEKPEFRAVLRAKLDSVMMALVKPRTVVRLDFTRTAKLYPGGTLLLLAYLEELLKAYPGRIRARCQPKSLAAQLLRHFGIADALGIDVADSEPRHESVVKWRYLTGDDADGQPIADLLKAYKEDTTCEPPEGLYDVLTEALTNVRHHAYPLDCHVPAQLRRWWLFARLNEPREGQPGSLFIAIYDIGVGIQNSLKPKLQGTEVALGAVDAVTESVDEMINSGRTRLLEQVLLQRAVEHPRTSTGMDHRGLGLPEMRDFVMATNTGRLYIVSGSAQYSCVPALNISKAVSCKDSATFPGTLILWSIPFGGEGKI